MSKEGKNEGKRERAIEGREVIYGKIFRIDVTNSHNAVYKITKICNHFSLNTMTS
jgi:hypothetical protein